MIGCELRSASSVLGLAALATLVMCLTPSPASAESVILPHSASGQVEIEMTVTDAAVSGTVSVVNPNARALTVKIVGKGAIADCTFAPTIVEPLSTTDVDVKSDHCTLDKNGDDATITFAGATATSVAIHLTPKVSAKAASLGTTWVAFGLAAVGAGLLFLLIWKRRPSGSDGLKLTDSLQGVPDGWSFKDSWATNIGAVSTVFVAIFGTNDVVTALVGTDSKTLPGRLLIIAGISGLLIGIAPLVLKAIGPTGAATVRGLLVAAGLTTTAIAGQILAIYTALGVDDPSGSAWHDFLGAFHPNFALIVALLLLGLLAWYVYRTVRALLTPSTEPVPEPSDELIVASATLLAAQICCRDHGGDARGDGPGPSQLLDVAYILAVDHLDHLKKLKAEKRDHSSAEPPTADQAPAEPDERVSAADPAERRLTPERAAWFTDADIQRRLDEIATRAATAPTFRSALL